MKDSARVKFFSEHKNSPIPKRILGLLYKRDILAQELNVVSDKITDYCCSIGLDERNPDFDDAILLTDFRIYTEMNTADTTISYIEKTLEKK